MTGLAPFPQLLLTLSAVILGCRAGATLFRRLGQPPVVGEIIVSILMGPTLLGWLWPQAHATLFPPGVTGSIDALGQLGLVAFMFLVGLELDTGALRRAGRTAAVVSQAGVVLPLLLGGLLALAMYEPFAPPGVARPPFVLFIAVAMSITAFPVLARVLTDQGLSGTRLGTLAMMCAAVDDVTAWCLLAAVVALASSGSPLDAATTGALTVAFVAALIVVVRPLLARWVRRTPDRDGERDGLLLTVLFSGLCLSALVSDHIGVHALFGAFAFGAITPRGVPAIERCAARLQAVVLTLFVPLYFVRTGLHTDFGALGAVSGQWWWVAAVLAVAMLGKVGGSAVAARACGQSWQDALSLGALMNCRGLTELVILNVGLQLGVIGPDLFSVLVLMALVTTVVTTPALRLLRTARSAEVPSLPDATAPEPAVPR
ncbi:cation:proton antiporter [Streptomyces sp. NPDC001339]|uniref:cation:proton antiporter n=1 Tax=Streptomyces sp. NPDC001339 TaxID=3364563 RepID=UPI0036C7B6A1